MSTGESLAHSFSFALNDITTLLHSEDVWLENIYYRNPVRPSVPVAPTASSSPPTSMIIVIVSHLSAATQYDSLARIRTFSIIFRMQPYYGL